MLGFSRRIPLSVSHISAHVGYGRAQGLVVCQTHFAFDHQRIVDSLGSGQRCRGLEINRSAKGVIIATYTQPFSVYVSLSGGRLPGIVIGITNIVIGCSSISQPISV